MIFPLTCNYRSAWLLGLSCVCCALLTPHARAQDNAELVERARQAINHRQFDQARADLATVLARSSWNEAAMLEQARLLYFERSLEAAWKQVTILLGEYPRNAAALNLRGLLNVEWKQNPTDALADFTAAVQQDPTYAKAFINRARALRTLKRPAEALADADAAIKLVPAEIAYLWSRGMIYLDLQQPKAALNDFDAAIALNPNDAEMLVRRAMLRHMQIQPSTQAADFQAMKPDIDRALELNPSHPEALLLRGYYLEFQNDPAGAFDSYCQAYQKLPNDTRVWQALEQTSRTLFTEGHDAAPVYQLLAVAKADFVRSGYSLEAADRLNGIFQFIPRKVSYTNEAQLRNKDYYATLLAENPGNLRLLYHVHANVTGGRSEQAMRTFMRDYDKSKDTPFAARAALNIYNNLRFNRPATESHTETVRAYQEAASWLAKAVELDPSPPMLAFVKPKAEELAEKLASVQAQHKAEFETTNAMNVELQALNTRFAQLQHWYSRANENAVQHMERAKALLRTDRQLSQTWRSRAIDELKIIRPSIDKLTRDLVDFQNRYPNAPQDMKTWVNRALNYLTHAQGDLSQAIGNW